MQVLCRARARVNMLLRLLLNYCRREYLRFQKMSARKCEVDSVPRLFYPY